MSVTFRFGILVLFILFFVLFLFILYLMLYWCRRTRLEIISYEIHLLMTTTNSDRTFGGGTFFRVGLGRVNSIFFGRVPENFRYSNAFGYYNAAGYWNVFRSLNTYYGHSNVCGHSNVFGHSNNFGYSKHLASMLLKSWNLVDKNEYDKTGTSLLKFLQIFRGYEFSELRRIPD